MRIHNEFIGGNIEVKEINGNNIYLKNELRDTAGDWFYWAFCAEGAENEEYIFHFDKNRLGYFGPAVSHNLKEWYWLDSCSGDSFSYRFGENEGKVYFAHHLLYNPDRFFDFAERKGFEISELCKSRKGRGVPCIRLGNGNKSIILTARHHACESTGSYILEGVLEALSQDIADTYRILCVPFADYDGVLDGDQGKARSPHDHNRDYIDFPLYPEVRAIKEYTDIYGCNYGFDFHSPWHLGGENDTVFIVRNSLEKTDSFDRFSEIFEGEVTEKSMDYRKSNDHPPFTGWNQGAPGFSFFMNNRPECDIAFTLESAYFGTEESKASAERLIETGKAFGRAVIRYIGN